MSNFETEHPQLNKVIELATEFLPILEGFQQNIQMLTPMLIQITAVVATIFVAFTIKGSVNAISVRKNTPIIPTLQKLATPIYALILLLIARGGFMFAEFETMWIDIAIVLTAIKAIPYMFEHTSLEKRSQRKLTLFSWVILALILTQNIAPIIDFLDSSTFTIGKTTISPWAIIKAIAMFSFLIFSISKATQLFEKHVLKNNKKLSASARTLIVKVTNILGLAIAFLITLDIIGIDLAAFAFFGGALGIGIGFGLQKIVSNLISGMILIIDKSIKPGDVISMNESYGVITSMQARYCVLRRRDGMEILIPNEMLMTNEVINWSYNNKNVRTIISVGVSYDSDIEKVQKMLYDIAINHPRVLKTPEPRALVTAFADSSINFEVRYWISDPEEGLGAIRSEIYMEIWKQFKEAGIEIPFPQRVIHYADKK